MTNIKVSNNILVIGDTHLGPGTAHKDYLKFNIALRDHYETDTTLHVGDLADWSSISYHEKEFNAVSPDRERELIVKSVKPWAEAFPEMYISQGNHGLLPRRKLKSHGLPLAMLGPDHNWLVGGPKGWQWSDQWQFKLECGITCVMAHTFSGNWTALAKMADTCALIQGHHHSMAGVVWSDNPHGRTFGMSAGCGINPEHPVFSYSKRGRGQLTKPLLGSGVILNGTAYWMPMWTNKRGRWTGVVP